MSRFWSAQYSERKTALLVNERTLKTESFKQSWMISDVQGTAANRLRSTGLSARMDFRGPTDQREGMEPL